MEMLSSRPLCVHMSLSHNLGSYRLGSCGHCCGHGQLETGDEAVDASLELVKHGQQVGRLRLLVSNLAWRCKTPWL